jgi:hypothetical protein
VPEGSGCLLFPKNTPLLAQHLSLFLKSEVDQDWKTPTELLKVDFRNPKLQLNKKRVFVGLKANPSLLRWA